MCKSMIPKKTVGLNLAENANKYVETKGYDCRLSVYSGEVYIKISELNRDDDAFILKAGQEFLFCGKICVKAKQASDIRMVMFDRL